MRSGVSGHCGNNLTGVVPSGLTVKGRSHWVSAWLTLPPVRLVRVKVIGGALRMADSREVSSGRHLRRFVFGVLSAGEARKNASIPSAPLSLLHGEGAIALQAINSNGSS